MIISRVSGRRPRGAAFLCAGLLAVIAASASASSVAERANPFQICLEGRYDKWVDGRAELVANQDAKAGDVDDAAVASWVMETLSVCRAQAGGGDQALEQGFTKRVAQWRQHIYDRVQRIHELARPD